MISRSLIVICTGVLIDLSSLSNIHIFDETLSIAMGSSTTSDINKRLEDLIRLADKAMYIQKEIDHKRLGIPSR